MIFKYRGIDKKGNKIKDKIEASDLNEAKAKLKARGIIYQKIEEEKKSIFQNFSFSMKYKIPPKELASLSRELAMYLRSGISLVSAIKIISSHYQSNKKIELFLKTISSYLDEGKDFYTALQMQEVVALPEFYKESIKVSENGGILDDVLMELSKYLKEQEKIQKEIKSAFAYPSFMIIVSFGMIIFMLTFVVPQITSIFKSMGQKLPNSTLFVINAGNFFSHHFQVILFSLFFVVAIFTFLKRKFYSFAYWIDKIILKIPILGNIVMKSELARFAYMASLLIRSGVPFVQAVNLSANILNNRVIKKTFLDASEKVVEGKLLSQSLNEEKLKLNIDFLQAIAIGEETSETEKVLKNIAELYFEENRDTITILLTLLEPTLMLIVGGSIGFIVSAMLLPIFSMSIH